MDAKPEFWLVWRRDGRAPVCEHGSYHDARAEAERLAKHHPGSRFYVLSPCARGIQNGETIWSHYEPTGIDLLDDLADDAPQGVDA